MILILSRSSAEKTTNIVIDNLIKLNVVFFRLNGDDLFNGVVKIDFELKKGKWSFVINVNDTKIKSDIIKAVWFRRNFTERINNILGNDKLNAFNTYLRSEIFSIYELLEYSLKDAFWLNTITNPYGKLIFLAKALESNLLIPESFITNNLDFLVNQNKKNNLITKPCTEGLLYTDKDKNSYPINIKRIKTLPNRNVYFPSFFQEEINTEYELRVFYLYGKTYSIQINNKATKNQEIDVRKVITNARISKYKLPNYLICNIDVFMKKNNLNSGSLDFIKTKKNEYVFLEVNPVGQIDFVSKLGYFNIEKDIAKLLYEKTK